LSDSQSHGAEGTPWEIDPIFSAAISFVGVRGYLPYSEHAINRYD
jgi:hypothetical protein